ncbi:MAG: hypothetical protein ACYCOU_00840 [Sulfobacillus sp.]
MHIIENMSTPAHTHAHANQPQSEGFKVVNLLDFDPSKITVGKAKPNKNNSSTYSMNISYEGARFYLRMPKMRTPYGISTTFNNNGYNIQLSLPDESTDLGKKIIQKFDEFDKVMIKAGQRNYEDWHIDLTKLEEGDDINAEIRKKYSKSLKYTFIKDQNKKKTNKRDPNYPPHLICQVPMSGTDNKNKTFRTEFYDQHGAKMDIRPSFTESGETDECRAIPFNSEMTSLLNPSGWSVPSTGFGVVWRLEQAKVYPRADLPRGQCLIQDSDEEGETTTTQPHNVISNGRAPAPAPASAPVSAVLQDSDPDPDPEIPESAPEPPRRTLFKRTAPAV